MTIRQAKLKKAFLEKYDQAKTELQYKNNYELLIAIILSAQCTDKRVNIITPNLFKAYPDTKELSQANENDIKNLIKTCSFFNNKAINIIKMAKRVEEKHNSKIPSNEKDLMLLAGVGQKTAHVFLGEAYQRNFMAVDTHVFRISKRLAFSKAKNVINVEKDLVRIFKTNLNDLHQAFILFGRYTCKAITPLCSQCFIYSDCKSKDKIK
jgi:endonuclease-3